jgi:hypothetical protein
MCMIQAYVWDHVVWTEMKVNVDSGGCLENKAKSMQLIKNIYVNFNVMAIEMKIQVCEIW